MRLKVILPLKKGINTHRNMDIPSISKISSRLNTMEILNLIDSGSINSSYLQKLKSLSKVSDKIISNWLNINVKTFRAHKNSNLAIKEDIQEHIIILISLIKHGIDVFGDIENFNKWLETENFHFGGKAPTDYLNTISGIKFTDDRLVGMEYGDNA